MLKPKTLPYGSSFLIGIFVCTGMLLSLVSCKQLTSPSGGGADAINLNKGRSERFERYGELYNAGWLGSIRIFENKDGGLVLYWMPRVRKVTPGTSLRNENEKYISDNIAIDATWVDPVTGSAPFTIYMIDEDHGWDNKLAYYIPEPVHYPYDDNVVLDNMRPCSGYPLKNTAFEGRELFTYSQVRPSTKLVIMIAQPFLQQQLLSQRADSHYPDGTFLPAPVGNVNVPACIVPLQSDPGNLRNFKDEFLRNVYLAPISPGDPPSFLMTLSMYYQLPDCHEWYQHTGIKPVEIQLYRDGIKPIPQIVNTYSYHPDQDADTCLELSL